MTSNSLPQIKQFYDFMIISYEFEYGIDKSKRIYWDLSVAPDST